MDFSMNITYITLGGHVELEKYRYFYFIMALTVYLLIIFCNGLVISAIYRNKRLHEPMYIFIAALLCNALFGSATLYPKLLTDLLSEQQIISLQACLLQAFSIYTYGASEYTLLSAMAYDRYVSICKPLQYATLVGINAVKKILFVCWFLPALEIGAGIVITSQLELCRFTLNRIFCDSYSVAKLSCKNSSASNLYGLFVLCVAVFPPVIFVLFSYIRILAVCLRSSKDFRRKALQTCLPHLIIFSIYSIISCYEVINSRLQSNQMPQAAAMMVSIENVLIPPLFNPIIYGLKMQEISKSIKRLILYRRRKQIIFGS